MIGSAAPERTIPNGQVANATSFRAERNAGLTSSPRLRMRAKPGKVTLETDSAITQFGSSESRSAME